MRARRALLMLLVTAVATAALGWLARAPWHPDGADAAVLRLSWRLRGEREEHCRTRSEAELAALPVHMRAPQVCESRPIGYRLVLQLDEGRPDTVRLEPAGARGDRPVFVLRDTALEPGLHRVRIELGREDGRGAAPFTLDRRIESRAGCIDLVTLDPEGGQLVHRTSLLR